MKYTKGTDLKSRRDSSDNPLGIPLDAKKARQIETLANQIKDAYINKRRIKFPYAAPLPAGYAKNRKTWWKAAHHVLEKDIDVNALIEAAFVLNPNARPDDLSRPQLLREADKWRRKYRDEIRQQLDTMKRLFVYQRTHVNKTTEEIIKQRMPTYNPVFLLAMANAEGLDHCVNDLLQEAREVIQHHPQWYDELVEFLPQGLKMEELPNYV